MQLQEHYLKQQLKNTWAFEPAVSLSVSGSLSGASGSVTGSAGASVSLSISAANLKVDEIKDLRDEIADLERDQLVVQVTLKIDEHSMQGSLEAAKLSSEIAERNLDSMETALQQASYDLERQNISSSEYRNVSQSKDLAEANYLDSLIAVYSQLGTLLQSYGDMES